MKEVFRYMNWENEWTTNPDLHPLDGNDMVLAINKMRENGDWDKFDDVCYGVWIRDTIDRDDECIFFTVWLFGDPANFFKLMEEWLKEKEKFAKK